MASSDPLAAALIARSKSLVNNDLKKICKEEGTVQSGNKAQLQTRVIGIINDAVTRGDTNALNRLRYRIHNHGDTPPASSSPSAAPGYPSHDSPVMAGGYNKAQNGYGGQHSMHYSPYQQARSAPGTHPLFKESPFFEVRDLVLSNMVLDASPSHRQTATRTLTISTELSNRMKLDPTYKLLLFSALEQPLSGFALHDIAFPSQIEVKINGGEVKANYKGLKNKPGSTRPADITEYVRITPPDYKNVVQITYALTQKASPKQKYNLYVYLVKKHSVDDLAKRITQRNVITKQSVLNEMRRKANDPDIEVGSVNMSLKDPISTLRIAIPCRSTICTHNQCFDAESFLQLQEQAPTWNCPICNKTVSFEGLAVDQYVQEILDNVPKGTDQVTIEPNGNWSHGSGAEKRAPPTNGYGDDYDDSDDDLVEIAEPRVSAIKTEAVPTPQSLARTPFSSREPSSAPRPGNKRKSEVIDLTLSDDDEPVRPAKKVAYHTPSSLPDPSHRYQAPAFGNSSAPMRPQLHARNSLPSALRRESPSIPQNNTSYNSYSTTYRPPPPRQSYSGQGTSTYPTYLGSSP